MENRAKEQAPSSTAGRGLQSEIRALPLLLFGLYFGVTQVALFFEVQVRLSATSDKYFLLVLLWMFGAAIGLRSRFAPSLGRSMAMSLACYSVLLVLIRVMPPSIGAWVTLGLLVPILALPAGTLFRDLGPRLSASSLFLHENNGFVLGTAIGMLLFVAIGTRLGLLGPPLAWILAMGAWRGYRLPVLGTILGLFAIGAIHADWMLRSVATVLVILSLVSGYRVLRAPDARTRPAASGDGPVGLGLGSIRSLLFLAGFGVVLLQYLVTREFASVLSGSELALLIVASSYLLGLSIGYFLSGFLGLQRIRWLVPSIFLLQLVCLFLARPIAGYAIEQGYGSHALYGLLVASALICSAFHASLLPTAAREFGTEQLARAYFWDLCGAGAGVVFLLTSAAIAPSLLLTAYLASFLAIYLLLLWRTQAFAPALIVGAALLFQAHAMQGSIRTQAAIDYYASRGYENGRLFYSAVSPYHSVEILDVPARSSGKLDTRRIAFLNGVKYFEGRKYGSVPSLAEYTVYLAGVPARFQFERLGRKLDVLVLGGGSLSSARRVAPFARSIEVVEIDPKVVEAALRAWPKTSSLLRDRRLQITVDDARHFLRRTEKRFDLIVNDVSAPYYLGTALMHGAETHALVRSRLSEDGVYSESTQGRVRPERSTATPMRILAAYSSAFPKSLMLTTSGWPRSRRSTYLYAGKESVPSSSELRQSLERAKLLEGCELMTLPETALGLASVVPLSESCMDTLLLHNQGRIVRRLSSGKPKWPSFSRVAAAARPDEGLMSRRSLRLFAELLTGTVPLLAMLMALLAWASTSLHARAQVRVRDHARSVAESGGSGAGEGEAERVGPGVQDHPLMVELESYQSLVGRDGDGDSRVASGVGADGVQKVDRAEDRAALRAKEPEVEG